MGKTIQVAADRKYDQTKTVLPAEYARGLYIKNAPSLRALKLMHLMIATAAGRMADDVRHEIRLSEINSIEGMSHQTKDGLKPLLEELRAVVLTYDDPDAMCYTVGGILDEAMVDYRHELTGELLVSWAFGRTFRSISAESNHWAIMDRQTVYHLGSKYSVLLFQHISSLLGLKHIQCKSFSIPEIRAIFCLDVGKSKRFADLKRNILLPAIANISELSRLNLKATTKKMGRTVVAIEISWEPKPDLKPAKKARISPLKSVKPIGAVTEATPAKSFPVLGSIEFSKPWNEIAKLNGNGKDKDLIATDFRNWCQARNIPLDRPNIEKTFKGFCKKAMP